MWFARFAGNVVKSVRILKENHVYFCKPILAPICNKTLAIRCKSQAVVFDMAGVVVSSPFPLTRRYEDERGIPSKTIWQTIDHFGRKGAWPKLEIGEINDVEFGEIFSKECSEVAGQDVDVKDFLGYLEKEMGEPLEQVVSALKCIRAEGIKLGLLTNNWKKSDGTTALLISPEYFDAVVESAKVGINKPQPPIYNRILTELGVMNEQCIFLDDIKSNIDAAKALGIRTVYVEDIDMALLELENILSFPLKGYVPGTRAVRKGLEISHEAIEKFLQDNFNVESHQGINIRQFSHGQSNPTYYVEYGSFKGVIRKKPPGKLLKSAHAVEREYRIMHSLHNEGIPVPKPLILCEDETVLGTPFYLMEYMQGVIYKNPMLPELSPERRTRVYQNMIDVLCKIHSVDLKKAGLEDYGKTTNYAARQLKTWTKQYLSSKTKEIPAMDRLMDWLPEHLPTTDNCTVVHGDFRLDNMMYDPNTDEVLGVIDWELSTLGDPISDITYACLAHFLPKDFPILNGMAGESVSELGIPTPEEIVDRYCRQLNRQPIENINFYYAFAFFRISAILQGVFKRALKGQASSSNAEAAGSLAEHMADIGWKFACRDGYHVFKKHDPVGLGTPFGTSTSKRHFSTQSNHAATGLLPINRASLRPEVQHLLTKLEDFMDNKILPIEKELQTRYELSDDKWTSDPRIEHLKRSARDEGLWNLFLPIETDPEVKYGAGLTNVEYAYLCEVMGRCIFASEVFNCSAPDTGNMEVLVKYGNEEQKKEWLQPLLDGSIRSCFAMTEPNVASSDASNIESSITSDGDHYIINGHKWWISGAMDKRTKFSIFMGKTDTNAKRHLQQSMVIVPMDSEGVTIVRPLTVFGLLDAPVGHGEIIFENVRVHKRNLIYGEGKGFEIAQGRLGPGRIHHCMRLIGQAERALELMKERVKSRVAFGKVLASQGTIQKDIADSRIEIEQARLLVLKTAQMMDTVGNKVAAPEIAMIKVAVPNMAGRVIDRAIQSFGAAGLNHDLPLASFYAWSRILRIADGPDEVHTRAIAQHELKD